VNLLDKSREAICIICCGLLQAFVFLWTRLTCGTFVIDFSFVVDLVYHMLYVKATIDQN